MRVPLIKAFATNTYLRRAFGLSLSWDMIRMELWFVTSSDDKLKEVNEFLHTSLKRYDLKIKEIQALGVGDVAEDKALKAYSILKKPVLVEDTGLYVRGLSDFPGSLVKWFTSAVGNEGVCKLMEGMKDRHARAETCFCLCDGSDIRTFCGEIEGRITEAPKGKGGFGWDSIFVPEGHDLTFAEMTIVQKGKLSMRSKALAKLSAYLKTKA
ncbi:Non-canonical purine NTP pyrophosphatase [uncultured archaeon]|nr:Non-canonical purine NTP pyrophosphatase [uncultured archaeon]